MCQSLDIQPLALKYHLLKIAVDIPLPPIPANKCSGMIDTT